MTTARLDAAFARLRADGRTGLVPFVVAGDPDLPRSREIVHALDRGGADVIELGVPFSDPVADGPVIQRAAARALAAGSTLAATLALAAAVRADVAAPIVLFTYANPVLRLGAPRFAREVGRAGVDGVLVLDLPVEEAGPVRDALAEREVATVFLVSPTTTPARIRRAAELGAGFLYAVSRPGVTGARERLADGARALVARIRAETALPVAVGFGVSDPSHVVEIGRWAEAAVVGSALVELIAAHGDAPGLGEAVEAAVRRLRGGSR